MPAVFAVADNVIANPVVATFASFGSFALLLLVGFGGPMRSRLTAQAALSATTAAFICLATLASNTAWLAVVAMAIVAFVVLFVGVVAGLASATTALLLAFILPVSIPAPASSIPYRLEGWGIAAGAAFLAVALLWPGPAEDPMRRPVTVAIRALASRLRSDVAVTQGDEPGSGAAREAVVTGADNAVSGMRRAFFASPYRPTGLSSGARSVVRLVDDLNWLNDIVRQEAPGRPGHPISRAACRVELAAAAVLEQSAQALDTPAESVAALHAADGGLDRSLDDLQRRVAVDPPIHPVTPAAAMVAAEVTTGAPDDPAQDGDETEQRITEFLTSLDPSFRAQEVSYAVRQVAAKVEFATLAEQRSILDRVLGRQPTGLPATRSTASELAAAHVRRHSVWLHNSIRGAVGLSLATLITTQSGVQHGFWVLLATLSVLRSNALSTGQNAFRALAGTVVGFIVGAALLAAIGTNRDLLWALLPVVVLLFGLAPATISFAAGQAAFTLTLVILFNIIQPAGWRVGLIRVEDIAIGCGVSLLVGIMFWPRGAASAFGQALAEAYQDSARYLQAAVEFGMGRCDMSAPGRPGPSKESLRAAARRPAAWMTPTGDTWPSGVRSSSRWPTPRPCSTAWPVCAWLPTLCTTCGEETIAWPPATAPRPKPRWRRWPTGWWGGTTSWPPAWVARGRSPTPCRPTRWPTNGWRPLSATTSATPTGWPTPRRCGWSGRATISTPPAGWPTAWSAPPARSPSAIRCTGWTRRSRGGYGPLATRPPPPKA